MMFTLPISFAVASLLSIALAIPTEALEAQDTPLYEWQGMVDVPSLERRSADADYLGYSSPYSFDINTISNPDWMGALPDSTPITNMSIPGTHDTMTSAEVLAAIGAQCQNNHLDVQLQGGIRYIDIRAWLLFNDLIISHGPAPTGDSLQGVFQTVFSFLDAHPGETIVMRIREENPPKWSNGNFVSHFQSLISGPVAAGAQKHLWTPPSPGSDSFPTLGQLRGKVVILQGFGSSPATYGIKWEDNALQIQDDYDAGTLPQLSTTKWPAILAQFNAALTGSLSNLYLNHLSASTKCLPIACATGSIGIDLYKGMNDYAGDWLTDPANGLGKRGIVIMDFPGAQLVTAILANNAVLPTS